MKPLDSIAKRDLLAAKKFDPNVVREYADDFFEHALYGDAFEFYLKIGDENTIKRVKQRTVEVGDPEVLWRIEHADRQAVTREDWAACGDKAMALGKFRSAAYAFKHIGDAEKAAAAEKEFSPPAEETPSAE